MRKTVQGAHTALKRQREGMMSHKLLVYWDITKPQRQKIHDIAAAHSTPVFSDICPFPAFLCLYKSRP